MSTSTPLSNSRLNSLLQKLHFIEDSLLATLLLCMILLATSQIFLRNLFDSGIVWADPLLRVMVLWLGLLGALAATRENKHITIDLLTRFLSELMQYIAKAFTNLFSAVISSIIAYHSMRFVIMEYEENAKAFLNIPAWTMEIILPIAFGLIALRFMIHFFIAARNALANKSKQSAQ